MLYVTTRGSADAYTAYKTLVSEKGTDGGLYVPLRMPGFTAEQIAELKESSFNQTAAQILNLFFSCHLSGWDLDFDIGRTPARLVPINHRVVIAELWHNPKADFSYITDSIYKKITDQPGNANIPSEWMQIASRIAAIFGIYSEMLRSGILEIGQAFDLSVYNDGFVMPIAVWYCRKMGLPVSTVVCTCEDENNIWDFIHKGSFSTSVVSSSMHMELERLVRDTLGPDEVRKYTDACQKGRIYTVAEEDLPGFNDGLFCAVAGSERAGSTINSVFRSNNYIIDPRTALCYGGLQDYRAKTGINNLTLLIAQHSPLDHQDAICSATGIAKDKLIDHVKLK